MFRCLQKEDQKFRLVWMLKVEAKQVSKTISILYDFQEVVLKLDKKKKKKLIIQDPQEDELRFKSKRKTTSL